MKENYLRYYVRYKFNLFCFFKHDWLINKDKKKLFILNVVDVGQRK